MNKSQVRIAYDGDAVLFSDEAEKVFQENGLSAFEKSKKKAAKIPLSGGSFKKFLQMLHQIQSEFPADKSQIITALVTVRDAPAHERAIRTLREWGVRVDGVFFRWDEKKSISRGFWGRYFL